MTTTTIQSTIGFSTFPILLHLLSTTTSFGTTGLGHSVNTPYQGNDTELKTGTKGSLQDQAQQSGGTRKGLDHPDFSLLFSPDVEIRLWLIVI